VNPFSDKVGVDELLGTSNNWPVCSKKISERIFDPSNFSSPYDFDSKLNRNTEQVILNTVIAHLL